MMKRGKKDHRTSNLTRRQGVREIKQSFLIVCEGEKTEPDYFKAFRMTAATIKAVGQAGGYVYIMDVTGGIPYISTTLSTDVTAEVKKKLGM